MNYIDENRFIDSNNLSNKINITSNSLIRRIIDENELTMDIINDTSNQISDNIELSSNNLINYINTFDKIIENSNEIINFGMLEVII